jgi:invasion protein IalB
VGRLAPNVLKLWRTGKLAQFAFIEEGGKQMLLPIILSGFDDALSALRAHIKAKN